MKRVVIAAVSLTLVGSILFAFSWRRHVVAAPSTPANGAVSAEVEALRDEVRQLKAELRQRVESVPGVAPAAPAAAPGVAGSAALPVPETPERAEQTPQQRHDQTATDLDVRMAREPADASWGRQAAAEIREAVVAGAPSARILETECATSLCRVVVAHDSTDDQKGLGTALASLGPFRHGVFFHYDPDSASPRTSMYVIREGYSFRDGE